MSSAKDEVCYSKDNYSASEDQRCLSSVSVGQVARRESGRTAYAHLSSCDTTNLDITEAKRGFEGGYQQWQKAGVPVNNQVPKGQRPEVSKALVPYFLSFSFNNS